MRIENRAIFVRRKLKTRKKCVNDGFVLILDDPVMRETFDDDRLITSKIVINYIIINIY